VSSLIKCAILCADPIMARHYEDVLTDKDIYCIRRRGFEAILPFDDKFSPDIYFVDFSCVSFKGIDRMFVLKQLRSGVINRRVLVRRKMFVIGCAGNPHLFKIVDRWVDSVHDIWLSNQTIIPFSSFFTFTRSCLLTISKGIIVGVMLKRWCGVFTLFFSGSAPFIRSVIMS